MALSSIPAEPFAWPYDGDLRTENTALFVIDMQVDFCGSGGYFDKLGVVDISIMQRPIEPLKRVLSTMREKGFHILHAREGHRADLTDLNENKRWRSEQNSAEIGSPGPAGRIWTRGEPGWDITPELAPLPGEPIIDKPGKGGFYATDLDQILRRRGIRNLVITGITSDCCVHSTMRQATDHGYECVLLEDCSASTEEVNHDGIVRITKAGYGQFGVVSDSETLLKGLP